MSEEPRAKFTSWDGLEEDELDDLRAGIRDALIAKEDITKRIKASKPVKMQEGTKRMTANPRNDSKVPK